MVDLKQIPIVRNRPIGRRGIRDVGGPFFKILYKQMGVSSIRKQPSFLKPEDDRKIFRAGEIPESVPKTVPSRYRLARGLTVVTSFCGARARGGTEFTSARCAG
jgi:hypothetical protein